MLDGSYQEIHKDVPIRSDPGKMIESNRDLNFFFKM